MKQFFKFMFASMLGTIIAGGVALFLLISVLIGVSSYLISSTHTQKEVEEHSILHLHLKGELCEVETSEEQLLNALSYDNVHNLSLSSLRSAIKVAKEDKHIEGIFLEIDDFSCGISSARELRESLIDFKKSGKWVFSYGDYISQTEYYIASVADTIVINPYGRIHWKGLSRQVMLYHSLMEKVGISVEVAKVGSYKSAVEPFLYDKISEENRTQITSYIQSIWKDMMKDVFSSRGISVERLNELADEGQLSLSPIEYKKSGLVDVALYKSGMDSLLKVKCGIEGEEKPSFVDENDLVSMEGNHNKKEKKIAILYAVGEIDGTDADGISSKDFCKQIQKVKEDKSICAVVLRINSPGGSAYGAEQMWHEIECLKREKPVVVSMGDCAASGGYYIACNASYIFAQPTTLTGSIGVFALVPNAGELAKKVGLSFEVVKTNEFANFPSLARGMSEKEKGLLQKSVNDIYSLFIHRCSEGRNMTEKEIELLAEGRVWTGSQACKSGLIDEIGGIDQAIEKASKLANVEDYVVEECIDKKGLWKTLMKYATLDAKMYLGKWVFGEDFSYYSTMEKMKKLRGVQMRVPYELNVN
ncbi:MAG TPA: signal peptide peptidase SppA [Porphyromonadaceae bacterium]|nr:signal peptide peptidase SppA [Porphyromonadaceae bacterium]